MFEKNTLILASKSASRKTLLENAGLEFHQVVSNVDERIIQETFLKSGELTDLAMVLAQAKAMEVSQAHQTSFVIGADQSLLFKKKVFNKPKSIEEARNQLLELSGKQHQLETAVVVAKNGEFLWSCSDSSFLSMRNYSPKFVGEYLALQGESVKSTVGGYQLEGRGLQLFKKIEGDFFSILGIPMLKLLTFLRSQNLIGS